MLRSVLIGLAAASLSACSAGVSRTVDHPVEDVRVMLQANERSLMLDHYLPSASHKTDHAADGLVWRFMLNERDYARMTISLRPESPQSTRVSSRFEAVNDAVGAGIPFLRKAARAASEEVLGAALDGRPVDLAALHDQLKTEAAKDPGILSRGYIETSAQMYKEIQANGGAFAATSNGAVRGSQPYDKPKPYDRAPAYDRN